MENVQLQMQSQIMGPNKFRSLFVLPLRGVICPGWVAKSKFGNFEIRHSRFLMGHPRNFKVGSGTEKVSQKLSWLLILVTGCFVVPEFSMGFFLRRLQCQKDKFRGWLKTTFSPSEARVRLDHQLQTLVGYCS